MRPAPDVRRRASSLAVSPALRAATALVAAALAGCGATPTEDRGGAADAEAGAGHEEADEEALARDAARRAAEAREVAQLLPLDPALALWYRVTTPVAGAAGPAAFVREAAFFTSRLPTGEPALESAGALEARWEGLTFARGPREVVVLLDAGLGRGGYRAWTPDATWDRDRGRRLGVEPVETPAGTFRALRTEHGREEQVLLRAWLAREVGVVRFEVVVQGARALLLELVERAPRGPPAVGYDAASPAALWRSVGVAVRRLDVDAFERLLAPALRARARRTGWDHVGDLVAASDLRRAPPSEGVADAEASRDRDLAARVRAEVGDLLALEPRVRGAWQPDARDPDVVTAPALVTQLDGDVPRPQRAVLVLRRAGRGGAWRWDDLRLLEER